MARGRRNITEDFERARGYGRATPCRCENCCTSDIGGGMLLCIYCGREPFPGRVNLGSLAREHMHGRVMASPSPLAA